VDPSASRNFAPWFTMRHVEKGSHLAQTHAPLKSGECLASPKWNGCWPGCRTLLCIVIMPSSLPAGIHGANHRETDALPHVDALECGASVLAAALGPVEVAAGYLDPRLCEDDPHHNVAPTRAGRVADGSRSEAMKSTDAGHVTRIEFLRTTGSLLSKPTIPRCHGDPAKRTHARTAPSFARPTMCHPLPDPTAW
jgi:hypothetical protein